MFSRMLRIKDQRSSNFSQYVGDVGFVEGLDGEALLAEVVEGGGATGSFRCRRSGLIKGRHSCG